MEIWDIQNPEFGHFMLFAEDSKMYNAHTKIFQWPHGLLIVSLLKLPNWVIRTQQFSLTERRLKSARTPYREITFGLDLGPVVQKPINTNQRL